jgi:hypothetical protein
MLPMPCTHREREREREGGGTGRSTAHTPPGDAACERRCRAKADAQSACSAHSPPPPPDCALTCMEKTAATARPRPAWLAPSLVTVACTRGTGGGGGVVVDGTSMRAPPPPLPPRPPAAALACLASPPAGTRPRCPRPRRTATASAGESRALEGTGGGGLAGMAAARTADRARWTHLRVDGHGSGRGAGCAADGPQDDQGDGDHKHPLAAHLVRQRTKQQLPDDGAHDGGGAQVGGVLRALRSAQHRSPIAPATDNPSSPPTHLRVQRGHDVLHQVDDEQVVRVRKVTHRRHHRLRAPTGVGRDTRE